MGPLRRWCRGFMGLQGGGETLDQKCFWQTNVKGSRVCALSGKECGTGFANPLLLVTTCKYWKGALKDGLASGLLPGKFEENPTFARTASDLSHAHEVIDASTARRCSNLVQKETSACQQPRSTGSLAYCAAHCRPAASLFKLPSSRRSPAVLDMICRLTWGAHPPPGVRHVSKL